MSSTGRTKKSLAPRRSAVIIRSASTTSLNMMAGTWTSISRNTRRASFQDTPWRSSSHRYDVQLTVRAQGDARPADIGDNGGGEAGRGDQLRQRLGTGRDIVDYKHITFSGHQRDFGGKFAVTLRPSLAAGNHGGRALGRISQIWGSTS